MHPAWIDELRYARAHVGDTGPSTVDRCPRVVLYCVRAGLLALAVVVVGAVVFVRHRETALIEDGPRRCTSEWPATPTR
jgi:hypothetical protein